MSSNRRPLRREASGGNRTKPPYSKDEPPFVDAERKQLLIKPIHLYARRRAPQYPACLFAPRQLMNRNAATLHKLKTKCNRNVLTLRNAGCPNTIPKRAGGVKRIIHVSPGIVNKHSLPQLDVECKRFFKQRHFGIRTSLLQTAKPTMQRFFMICGNAGAFKGGGA